MPRILLYRQIALHKNKSRDGHRTGQLCTSSVMYVTTSLQFIAEKLHGVVEFKATDQDVIEVTSRADFAD